MLFILSLGVLASKLIIHKAFLSFLLLFQFSLLSNHSLFDLNVLQFVVLLDLRDLA